VGVRQKGKTEGEGKLEKIGVIVVAEDKMAKEKKSFKKETVQPNKSSHRLHG
jgi:hypothetical protein